MYKYNAVSCVYLLINTPNEKEVIMDEKKYSAQQKHLRSHYVRFSIDYRPEMLEEFKEVCKKNGTTPTAEIKKFVKEYCEKNK